MELKTYMDLALKLLNMHFSLCGYSVSVLEILIYFAVAAILSALIRGILL